MEENLVPNSEVNKEITDETKKLNSEEKIDLKSDKVININENNPNLENNSASIVDKKNEKTT